MQKRRDANRFARQMLLGEVDAVEISARARVDDGKLRAGEIPGADLDPTSARSSRDLAE